MGGEGQWIEGWKAAGGKGVLPSSTRPSSGALWLPDPLLGQAGESKVLGLIGIVDRRYLECRYLG
jgi:hypothetical protein